jgi:hypothetical protein
LLFRLVVFLVPLSFGSPTHAGSPDIAALVASCALVQNAIKLSPDGDVLCFDGQIKIVPLDEVRKLNNGGTFVARSHGGNIVVAMLIADILKEKNATVVLHGYCLSACANTFFVATHETHVARETVVAWHGDGLRNLPCPPPAEYLMRDGDAEGKNRSESYKLYCLDPQPLRTFYQRRGIKDDFTRQPQTRYSRQRLHAVQREAVNKRSIFWMWHPENFGSYFKSKITFMSFPRSQEQVNQWLKALRLAIRIVYDPAESDRPGTIQRFGTRIAPITATRPFTALAQARQVTRPVESAGRRARTRSFNLPRSAAGIASSEERTAPAIVLVAQ